MGTEYKAVHEMLNEDHRPQAVDRTLPDVLTLGFRFLAWINGVGVLLVVLCALGIVPTEVPAYFLRMPLLAFLCGLALAGLGLLWVYMAQASLGLRARDGRRRPHWIPVLCVLGSYCVSMVTFAVGCWLLVGMGSLANDDWSYDESWPGGPAVPQHQSAEPPQMPSQPALLQKNTPTPRGLAPACCPPGRFLP
ncbi:MAG: hypothetical protein QHC66_13830 [Pusillimonas sp.]|nr:hypothetical protein [Pusillimonas sp.]